MILTHLILMRFLAGARQGVAPVETPSKVGGDDVPTRRRFQVKVKNQIHEFWTDAEALDFLNSLPKRQKRKALVLQAPKASPAVGRVFDDLMDRLMSEDDDEEALLILL